VMIDSQPWLLPCCRVGCLKNEWLWGWLGMFLGVLGITLIGCRMSGFWFFCALPSLLPTLLESGQG